MLTVHAFYSVSRATVQFIDDTRVMCTDCEFKKAKPVVSSFVVVIIR